MDNKGMTKDALLDKILKTYQSCYDIERNDDTDDLLVATADYHERQSGYILIRRAEMWSADRHEYTYFYRVPQLDLATFEACMARTRELGGAKVNPQSGHMSSNVVAVFLCDDAQEEAVRALTKYRYRKNFSFSFRGWMEIHAAAALLEKDRVVSNAAGVNVAKFLELELHPEKRRKKKKNIFSLID